MKPTSDTGVELLKSFASCMTTPSTLFVVHYRLRVGGADTAGSGGQFTRDFIEHCLNGKNYATVPTALLSTSSPFTLKVLPGLSMAMCRWALRINCRRSIRVSQLLRLIRS